MNDTPMKKVAMPVFLRRSQRTWLTHKGHVVTAQPAEPAPVLSTVHWAGKVIDTATERDIDSYPKLDGSDSVVEGGTTITSLQLVYMNRCRFVDGPKPDIELLQSNVNAGIWQIEIDLVEPETASA